MPLVFHDIIFLHLSLSRASIHNAPKSGLNESESPQFFLWLKNFDAPWSARCHNVEKLYLFSVCVDRRVNRAVVRINSFALSCQITFLNNGGADKTINIKIRDLHLISPVTADLSDVKEFVSKTKLYKIL